MMKYLSHFWARGGVKAFDTETGAVAAAPNVPRNETGFGSLWKQNGKWFALHNDDESILFQQGKNKWRVIPDYEVSLTSYFLLRNFRISRDSRVVFSIWYMPNLLFLFLEKIDPTHDALDAESDDFFLHLKETWKSWSGKPFSEFRSEILEQINNRVHSDAPEGGA